MTISNEIREQVIKEYEAQKYFDKCSMRVKTKPLGRAQQYFRLLTMHYGGLGIGRGWFHEVNERVKHAICEKYGLTMITELNPECYDEANDLAIEMFTEETEKSEYYHDKIDYYDLPWVRNRFTGALQHTRYVKTWDEWKEMCRKQVYR